MIWIANSPILQMRKLSLRKVNNSSKVSKCQYWNSNAVNFRARVYIEGRTGYIMWRTQSNVKIWGLLFKKQEKMSLI